MAFKTGSGATLKTAITDTRIIQGNQTGRKGELSWNNVSGNIVATPNLDTGNLFTFNPPDGASGVTGDLRFVFNSSPLKNHYFYLIWHNYQDSFNTSSTFNNYQEVKFSGGYTTLNNSTSDLSDGMTQIFKFTTTVNANGSGVLATPPDWFGTLYMKNCPPSVTPRY